MKKVLVLAAAIALFATPALALITNSAHDLSGAGAGTTELCIFCHTPHGAAALNGAPLWNRNSTDAGVTNLYTSSTITAATTAVTAGGLNSTDVVLCLSCHDGTKLSTVTLNNVPTGTTYDPSGLTLTAAANIGTNLSNDHPIGMNYSAAQGADAGLVAAASTSWVVTNEIPLFSGIMWCSSCHAVHNDANAPFLRKANTGSALCLACHAK